MGEGDGMGTESICGPLEGGKRWGEAVYEYTRATPRPGNQMGKMDGGALQTKLFWIKKPEVVVVGVAVISCGRGGSAVSMNTFVRCKW